jgi:hypothetical protein
VPASGDSEDDCGEADGPSPLDYLYRWSDSVKDKGSHLQQREALAPLEGQEQSCNLYGITNINVETIHPLLKRGVNFYSYVTV